MLKRNWKFFFVVFSQTVDLLSIWLAGAVIFTLKWNGIVQYATPDDHLRIGFIFFALIYVVIASMMGLYRGSFHLSLRLQNLIMARSFVLSIMITLILNNVGQTFVEKKSVITFVIVLPFFLLVSRIFLRQINLYFQSYGFGIHNSLIVGFERRAEKVFKRFSSFPELGYKIKGFIVHEKSVMAENYKQYHYDDLEKVIEELHIDRIFIPTTDFSVNGYAHLQNISQKKGIKLKIISPEAEDLLKISRVYDLAGITLTHPKRFKINKIKCVVKRMFDFFASLIIIVLLSPFFIAAIIAIFIETGRPIFFLQNRSGIKNGTGFNFIKFRSMITNAEQLQQELLECNESDGALFKMKDDPRVTRVGKIIRKLSIDELPQLFNVLKGEMSLVGPRPLPQSDFEKANESEEFWEAIKDRASVKPGMTGLWQISGRSEIKFKEMILLDLYYVENHSLLFDLEILFETIPAVLFGRGAY